VQLPVCICVFAKLPVAGQVKTRLIPQLGSDGAADLALALLEDTWTSLAALPWARPILAFTEADPPTSLPGAEVWGQGDGDLGARLARMFLRALQDHPCAIAVGSDSPGLPTRIWAEARDALAQSDAVLGPSADGGFYLLGLHRCPADLFSEIPWSVPTTCAVTLQRLKAAGFTVHLLETWFDVDTAADLQTLRSLLGTGRIQAPKTAAFLDTRPSLDDPRLPASVQGAPDAQADDSLT